MFYLSTRAPRGAVLFIEASAPPRRPHRTSSSGSRRDKESCWQDVGITDEIQSVTMVLQR